MLRALLPSSFWLSETSNKMNVTAVPLEKYQPYLGYQKVR